MAVINGTSSDDTLTGTGTADTITGDTGNDTITGGAGDDVIDGGVSSIAPTPLDLSWSAQGGDGTDVSGGFTQDTGGISVVIDITNDGGGSSATVETDTTYVDTGETFDPNSNLGLRGDGSADVWTVGMDFSAVSGSGFADEVENVAFRIQDIDASGWQDIVTVLAYDADGNLIPVSFTVSGDDTVLDSTITAGASSTSASDAAGSVLVEIAGPVARVEIIYQNGGTSAQYLLLSDVEFEAVPVDDDELFGEDGNDTISGGFGNDLLDGGANNDSLMGDSGNDTLLGGAGRDTLEGGAGQDSLNGGSGRDGLDGGAGNDTLIAGGGADTLIGGDGDDSLSGGGGFDILTGGDGADTLDGGNGNDTFYASGGDVIIGGEGGTDTADQLVVDDVLEVVFNPADPEAGTVYFNDGTTATFTGIETLVVNGGPDGIVDGTDGADLIDGGFVDTNLEQVDNNDGTAGTTGDQDAIEAGLGDDTVYAGEGDDSVVGGQETPITPSAETLSWIAEGSGTDIIGGFSQDTGTANLTVTLTNDGALAQSDISSTTHYTASGEPYSTTSGLLLEGSGGADVATLTVASDVAMTGVSFRINDVDEGGWEDILTVNAYDADGNPVVVTLTASGDDTVVDQTVTGNGSDDEDLVGGSVLVEIAGPIAYFEVIYENGGTSGQVVYLTDVHFTANPTDDDLLHGDQGNDTLEGGVGNDTLFGDQLAVDPTTIPSGTSGTATSVTFANDSPYAVELAQVDATGTIVSVITIPAGSDFTATSTTQTNWVLLDPDSGDILQVYETPADGTTLSFDSAGADSLSGGLGNDVLSGDFGNDTLNGGAGDDSMSGGSGEDLFTFGDGFGTDTVAGGEDGDDLDTLDFSDMSTGINVLFDGDEQGDVADTGSGDSVEFTEIEQIVATDQDDTVDAGASTADQTILGGGGADSLTGGSGNDTIDGDSGDGGSDLGVLIYEDTFDAGADGWSTPVTDDTDPYFGSILGRVQGTSDATDIELSRSFDLDPSYPDAVIEFDFHRIDSWDNEEFQIYSGGQEIFSQAFFPGTEVGGSSTITIGGVTYNVTLTSLGDAAQNGYWDGESWTTDQTFRVRIEVENAPDTLDLGFGSTLNQDVSDESYAIDNFVIVSTDDTSIDPTLLTSAGSDSNDTIAGGDGDDVIFGEEGADVLSGDGGNDTIDGGDGADLLQGGAGEDSLTGGQGADTLEGGADADWFFGGSGDFIDGGEDGDDQDTLYLDDMGATIVFDVGNSENGTVTFSDGTTLTFENIETIIPCFTSGSRVETERGLRKVEDLRVGDLVVTRDNGLQPILWTGRKQLTQVDLANAPHLRPIRIRKGALGPNVPNRDMDVSPQHRMLIRGAQAEMLFGEEEVLVRAKHLTHLPGIDVLRVCERVTYIHLMCDAHEILRVDDAWTESFQPGDMVQNHEAREIFGALLKDFPELGTEAGQARYVSARLSLKAHEAALVSVSAV